MNTWRTRWGRWLAIGATALLLGTGLSVGLPGSAPTQAAGEKSVKLAWFSTVPSDGTTAKTLASKVDHVYLSRDQFGEELSANGYGGKIMQYKLASEVEGPGPYADFSAACNSSYVPLDNQIANKTGDFCRYLHPNESWFLHNGKGERLVGEWSGRYYYHMNPANTGWQDFARQRLERELTTRGFDGIHFDNVALSDYKAVQRLYNSDGVIKEYPTETEFRSAWVSYLASLSSVRSKGELWANLIGDRNTGSTWEDYLPHLDGAMVESFATGYNPMSVDAWNKQLSQYESALRQGKSVIALSQGEKGDTTMQTFALASYLLITDGQDAYFRYSNSRSYTQWWWYDNYDVSLGTPRGARYQSGSTWRRDFANGYVVVDPAARTGQIVITNAAPALDRSPAPDVSITGVSSGQTVSGTITVEASSSTAVDRVSFYLDGELIDTEGVVPYFLGGDEAGRPNGLATSQWPDGSHVLKVVATDAQGRTGAAQVAFNVQNGEAGSVPIVLLNGLRDGQTIAETITVEAVVEGGEFDTENIRFYLDDEWIGTEGVAPYCLGGDDGGRPNGFDTEQWSNGRHVLTAVATDANGNRIAAQVTITVAN